MKGMPTKIIALCLGLALSAAASAADLTGTWVLTVDSPQGTANPTMVLEQDGNNVTGTYEGSMGSAKLNGTVDGDSFVLNAEMSMQGMDFTLTYSGTQNGDSMKGDVDLAGMGGAGFTGERQ